MRTGAHLLPIIITGVLAPSPPSLVVTPAGTQQVVEGRGLVLACSLKPKSTPGAPYPQPVWYGPNGAPVPQDFRIYSEEEEAGTTSLFLKDLTRRDGGVFVCKAGALENPVRVNVRVGLQLVAAPVQRAVVGAPGLVECVVEGRVDAVLDWSRSGKVVREEPGRVSIGRGGVAISEISREDAGTYICRARVAETGELEETQILLEVDEEPEWELRPSNRILVEGRSGTIKCIARGEPSPRYSWYRLGNAARQSLPQGMRVESDGSLVIENISGSSSGPYVCVASSRAGSISASVQVSVQTPPVVEVEPASEVAISEGEGVTLACIARGEPQPSLQWIRVGEEGDDKKEVKGELVEEDEGLVSYLHLRGVKREDAGKYRCLASNVAGGAEAKVSLSVQFPPQFTRQARNTWSWDQRPATMLCEAEGNPPAHISWWINSTHKVGREILDKNFKIRGFQQKSELQVVPLTDMYYQDYLCQATNRHGTSQRVVKLSKAGKPGPIQQVVLELVTATSLRFQFVPPVDTGGLQVESFTAEYKEARQSWAEARRRNWFRSQEGRFLLEELKPWTSYHLRFSCRTPVGQSAWGNNLEVTLPRPSAPRPPFISLEGGTRLSGATTLLHNRSLVLTWEVAEDNPEHIDFWRISINKEPNENNFSSPRIVHWSQGPPLRVDLEEENSSWRVKASAHNKVGFSAESILWARTPPGEVVGALPVAHEPSSFSLSLLVVSFALVLVVAFLALDLALCLLKDRGFLFKGCTFAVSNVYRKNGRRSRR